MAARIAVSSAEAGGAANRGLANGATNSRKRSERTRFTGKPPKLGNSQPAYNEPMAAPAKASPFRVVHTVCSHDCPDSCAVLVTVDSDGRAVKLQGDPSQPVTQGFLCGKVAKYLDRVYSPQRILYPLRRKAGVSKGP